MAARRRMSGSGLISLLIGMKPATVWPGATAIGNARAAIASAAAARSAAGKESRRASAICRSSDFVASMEVDKPDLKNVLKKRKCGAAMAVGAFDPGFPTKVGGRHMSEPTSPVRDSSLKDR
jgi:hypothetical protein